MKKNQQDLFSSQPETRNSQPLIAEPFHRRSLIEKWGRGTQKIVEACLADGYPEPGFIEQAGAVYVRFPTGAYAPPTSISHDLTERQREILHVLGDGARRSFRDVYASLDDPPFSTQRSR